MKSVLVPCSLILIFSLIGCDQKKVKEPWLDQSVNWGQVSWKTSDELFTAQVTKVQKETEQYMLIHMERRDSNQNCEASDIRLDAQSKMDTDVRGVKWALALFRAGNKSCRLEPGRSVSIDSLDSIMHSREAALGYPIEFVWTVSANSNLREIPAPINVGTRTLIFENESRDAGSDNIGLIVDLENGRSLGVAMSESIVQDQTSIESYRLNEEFTGTDAIPLVRDEVDQKYRIQHTKLNCLFDDSVYKYVNNVARPENEIINKYIDQALLDLKADKIPDNCHVQ